MKTNFIWVLLTSIVLMSTFVSCETEKTQYVTQTDSTLVKKQEQTQKFLDSLKVVWNLNDSVTKATISQLNSEIGDVKNALAVANGNVICNKLVSDSVNSNNNPIYYTPNFRDFQYDSLGYLTYSKMYDDTIVTFKYAHYFTDTTIVQIGTVLTPNTTPGHWTKFENLYHVIITKLKKQSSLKGYTINYCRQFINKPKEIRLY